MDILDPFDSCGLDLEPMTFIYELARRPIAWRFTGCANMNFLFVKAFESYLLTDRFDRNYQPLRFAGGQLDRAITYCTQKVLGASQTVMQTAQQLVPVECALACTREPMRFVSWCAPPDTAQFSKMMPEYNRKQQHASVSAPSKLLRVLFSAKM